VTDLLLIIRYLLVVKVQIILLVLHILLFQATCIDNLFGFICNIGPLLCYRNHVSSKVDEGFLSNIFVMYAFDECLNFIVLPISLLLTSYTIIISLTFVVNPSNPLPLPLELVASIAN